MWFRSMEIKQFSSSFTYVRTPISHSWSIGVLKSFISSHIHSHEHCLCAVGLLQNNEKEYQKNGWKQQSQSIQFTQRMLYLAWNHCNLVLNTFSLWLNRSMTSNKRLSYLWIFYTLEFIYPNPKKKKIDKINLLLQENRKKNEKKMKKKDETNQILV